MKLRKRLIALTVLFVMISMYIPSFANSTIEVNKLNNEQAEALKATKIGIGGGGALFEPAISPFNSNEMLTVPDMGGIYVSHDTGLSWERCNLHGTVLCATYDPNREGVIYAGGSGVWRSTDYGKSFELIFPNENDITAKRLHNGNSLQYYFTKSGIYDENKSIKNILIDPEDSNHIFVLGYYNKNGLIYESTDNGESFSRIFNYTRQTSSSAIQFDFNELIYKRETKEIFAINSEMIIGYNLETKEVKTVYEPEIEIMDVSTVYENGKTYFIIIEKTNNSETTDTVIYYTNDFAYKVDLTDTVVNDINDYVSKNYKNNAITEVGPNYFVHNSNGKVTFKYKFNYVSATSLNNIYISNCSYATSSSIRDYAYTIDGILRYHDGKTVYLYGNPFYNHNYLAGRSWNDGCTYALGLAASMKNEDEFIFTTLNGVNYSPDNKNIYARHTTLVEGKYPNATFTTNGIDEQRTYAVCEDPFNENVMLLLNTDLGLVRSEDGGKSWFWVRSGIPSSWQNTIYDAEFDKYKEGVVYSLWSGRHNAPYNAGNETDGRYGGFAISYDSGATWDSNYSSGLPENAIPVKLSIVYNENSDDVTIYVATFNCGFYVSYNSGKTFTEMNNGIEKINYKEGEKYQYIFAQDVEAKNGRIFGLTTKTTYNGETQPGELFEYIEGAWVKIPLPQGVKNPTDVIYNKGSVYVCCTAETKWDGKNGAKFNSYAGGVYEYKNNEFSQIFDETISTTSVVFDSKDTMYISDMEGNIYRREKGETDYLKIFEDYHYRSESLQITDDDDRLYLSSHGGGMLKLENLNSLYQNDNLDPELLLGDIDQDGSITINDLAILKLYLIDEKQFDNLESLLADLDQDNKITINDLAVLKTILIEK